MVHLVHEIGNRPAVEQLILVPDVHIEVFRKRPIDPDKDTVLVKTGLRSSRTDCV